MSSDEVANEELLVLTADIIASHVSNNTVGIEALPNLVRDVFDALRSASNSTNGSALKQQPAVPVDDSVTADAIICLEDGKRLKMLKRHLKTHHGMTTGEYKAKWGLPADYPVVSPNYAKKRQQLAKEIGLGRRR